MAEPQDGVAKKIQDRVAKQLTTLDETLAGVKNEVAKYEADARREGSLHKAFTATLAVLAVAAPALVTYQTQTHGPAWLPFLVIFVTTIGGAGTALQGVFRWGDRFRRTRLTELELRELYSSVKLERQDIEDTDDPIKVYSKISALNQKAATGLQAILRNHIEAEVALVAPPTEFKDKDE
jgi:hypothetical protein